MNYQLELFSIFLVLLNISTNSSNFLTVAFFSILSFFFFFHLCCSFLPFLQFHTFPYTQISINKISICCFKILLSLSTFLNDQEADTTPVYSCPQLSYKYSGLFPVTAGVSSFLSDIFHFEDILCPSYISFCGTQIHTLLLLFLVNVFLYLCGSSVFLTRTHTQTLVWFCPLLFYS